MPSDVHYVPKVFQGSGKEVEEAFAAYLHSFEGQKMEIVKMTQSESRTTGSVYRNVTLTILCAVG